MENLHMDWEHSKSGFYKIGIIGAGYAAGLHSKALHSINHQIKQYVYDINPTYSQRFADNNGCTVSYSLENFYDAVDAVIIATPVWTHYNLVLDSINHGKHILCEKPMAKDGKEADVMNQLSQNRKLVCAIGFNYRFFDITFHLLQEIKKEPIREIKISIKRLFRDDWKNDETGVLSDLGIHLLDLITVLSGSNIDISTCVTEMKYENSCDYDSKVKGYTENRIAFSLEAARIENESAVCFYVELNSKSRSVRYISSTKERYIVVDKTGIHTMKLSNEQTTKDFFDFSDSIIRQDKEWIGAICGKSSNTLASFHDGYRSQIVLEALIENNSRGLNEKNLHCMSNDKIY